MGVAAMVRAKSTPLLRSRVVAFAVGAASGADSERVKL